MPWVRYSWMIRFLLGMTSRKSSITDRGTHGRFGRSAILRPSVGVLRPQPVQGEGMGPFGIALPVVPTVSFGRTIRRRPVEHEDVVVEPSGLDPSLGDRPAQCQRGNQTEAEKTEEAMP